jgi:hypothetical protein
VTFEARSKLADLGDGAFQYCSSLKSICIPSRVKAIPSICFSGCKKLSALEFEQGSQMSRILHTAFIGCASLQSVHLPASIELIFPGCFADSQNRVSIVLKPGCKLSAQSVADLRVKCDVTFA